MTNTVKSLFNKSTLGLFSSPNVDDEISEEELIAQQEQRASAQNREAELKSLGPSRKIGGARRVGRQLLAFLPELSGSGTRQTGRAPRARGAGGAGVGGALSLTGGGAQGGSRRGRR